MNVSDLQDDDDMPTERGQFYQTNTKLNMPVYLDEEVQSYLAVIATRQGVSLSVLANDLLKCEICIIEAVK